jgi:hypothetical protein
MSNKYHIAQSGKNAGKYVPCMAKNSCRIGGEHLTKEQAEIKNLIIESDNLLSPKKQEITNSFFAELDHANISHQEILRQQGFSITAFETFGDYQGDYAAIVEKNGKVGLVIIGYGSCSGCDALEGITDTLYLSYKPSQEDYENNPEEAKQNEEDYERNLASYREELQAYANDISNSVRYGSYEDLKEHIMGEDNIIKWYTSDPNFNESREVLIKGLDRAFNK